MKSKWKCFLSGLSHDFDCNTEIHKPRVCYVGQGVLAGVHENYINIFHQKSMHNTYI